MHEVNGLTNSRNIFGADKKIRVWGVDYQVAAKGTAGVTRTSALRWRWGVIVALTTGCFLPVAVEVTAQQADFAQAGPSRPLVQPPAALPRLPQLPDVPTGEVPSPVVVDRTAPTQAPPGADAVRFTLTAVVFDGVTVYQNEDLLPLYGDWIGREISLADVYDLRAELQKKYREDGYFLSRVVVAAQRISGGTVTLTAVEGYIDSFRVEGDVGAVQSLIESYLENVLNERPIRLQALERYLLLANDIPGITVVGVLQPSTERPGAAQLIATASRKWYDAVAIIDNFGSSFTGEFETAASATLNSFTRLGEDVTATGLVSFPEGDIDNNQKVGQLATSFRIFDEGTVVQGRVSYGNSIPAGTLSQFLFENDSLFANIAVSHPFVRGRNLNLATEVGFDFIDTDTDIFTNEPFSRDRLRVLYFTVRSDFRDQYRGATLMSAGVRQGVPIFNATRAEASQISRPDGTGLSTTARAEAARLQTLYDDLALYVRAAGQYAFNNVLQDEEFGVGASQFGRGFNPKEIAGDSGLGVTAELQYSWQFVGLIERLQAFGFYDYGKVWQRNTPLSEVISSVGGGLRFWPRGPLSFEVQTATPLARGTARAKGDKDTQLLFRAFARF